MRTYHVKHIEDTAAGWAANSSYIVPLGSYAFESDTGKLKRGDGATAVGDLSYEGTGGGNDPVEIILNNDQILALPSTYQEIVAGVAGTLNIPELVVIEFNFEFGAYSNVHAGNYMGISWGDFDVGATDICKFFGAGLDNRTVVLGIASYPDSDLFSNIGVPSTKTVMNGAALKVFAINADGDFEDGHEDNTMKITMYYKSLAVV